MYQRFCNCLGSYPHLHSRAQRGRRANWENGRLVRCMGRTWTVHGTDETSVLPVNAEWWGEASRRAVKMAGASGFTTASPFKVRPKDNVVFESCLGCFQIPIREIRGYRPFKPFLPHPPHTPSCPSHEVPLNELKGHFGALVFGGGEPFGRRQPPPTRSCPLPPPTHTPI